MKKEGFWCCNDDEESLRFPIPVANSQPWHNQELFVKALALVESKIPPDPMHCFLGWSDCRICGCMNGTMEYELYDWLWPEGFKHYIEKHNVKPSEDFIAFIVDKASK